MIHVLLLHALGFDYDEILMICMGLAATAYVILDFRREKRLDGMAIELSERVTQLEAQAERMRGVEDRLMAHAERIALLDGQADRARNIEDRLAVYGERIAVVETKLDAGEPQADDVTE